MKAGTMVAGIGVAWLVAVASVVIAVLAVGQPASCEGQDAQQGLAGTESGAVPAGQTPNLHHSSTTPGEE
jgi:hypothetical protein